MSDLQVLWADLRYHRESADIFAAIAARYETRQVADPQDLLAALTHATPRLLCFDFDRPHLAGLKLVQRALEWHQDLPTVLLTEQHSEALAVWAFRSGVRDYVIKPVMAADLCDTVDELLRGPNERRQRRAHHSSQPIPIGACSGGVRAASLRTGHAAAYIRARPDRAMRLVELAELCNLSTWEFSRVFKREHGLTCRDFLVRTRVDRARWLLSETSMAISRIADAVGFKDLSHFARVFRRSAGVTATQYRQVAGGAERLPASLAQKSSIIAQGLPNSRPHPCLFSNQACGAPI